ncbi:MAG: DUF2237 domain-containing protein [Gomphosphaeria aponina SAG 52.96 = DSM 107014]|uniref:DUF2237 domain-containing protein n=1 Tax=Gomphosphaeria aponina SAG 52.96 = DSM 107014 TaxID=1521640 RepID=A0A941GWM4_9CHRO|nr:DUF2237 domain-containing protein [Gomphosphaeria aponina SAG 52.96 = DSM 107014]
MRKARNVLGTQLEICCGAPLTGWYRNGFCETDPTDRGVHVVCVEVTDEFLEFSQLRGNDLSTPAPEFHFPGLKAGDRWCLCASRWQEALLAGVAPPVILQSTEESALKYVTLEQLKKHALDV